MIDQEIKKIKIEDLHLWTENPRDPMDSSSLDYEIIKRAIEDPNTKWNLAKMFSEMGQYYDFSELPTVVKIKGNFVVFDGNRRISIIKYLQDTAAYSDLGSKIIFKSSPSELRNLKEIPCNVCDKETALTNIERKHINNGSWGPLEREYFLNIHRKKEKSLFLVLEEQTHVISKNPKMNQRFVKDEILTEKNLKEIGFSFDKKNSVIATNYSEDKSKDIFGKIISAVEKGSLKTRGVNRGKLKESLLESNPELQGELRSFNKDERSTLIKLDYPEKDKSLNIKKTPRTKGEQILFFGRKLSLVPGNTNDLYRDIEELFDFYQENKSNLSKGFCSLIRMSLRLIVESATNKDIKDYITTNFEKGKSLLSKDQKTTLSGLSINTPQKLIELLQTGAHKYSSSSNIGQTVAISVIIGAMLEVTHSKK